MSSVLEAESASLAEQARRLGVSDRYHGFWGKEEVVPYTVLRRAVGAMLGDGTPRPAQHLGLPPVFVARVGEQPVLHWPGHGHGRWQLQAEEGNAATANGELQQQDGALRIALPSELAPGYYRLTLEGAPAEEHCRVVIAPRHCHVAAGLEAGAAPTGSTGSVAET